MKTFNCSKCYIYQRGFSLLELSISMALGLILFALLIQLYFWQLEIYHNLTDMVYLQENNRLAMQLLGDEIRTAGYCGCARLREGLITAHPADIHFTDNNSLQILPLDSYGNSQISIQKMATDAMLLKSGDIVVIADCQQAAIAAYDARHKQAYAGKQVNQFISERFFIADAKRKTPQNKPVFALYQRLDNGIEEKSSTVEVVDGIQQLLAEPVIDEKGELVAVHIFLRLAAPHGATLQTQSTFALRERAL